MDSIVGAPVRVAPGVVRIRYSLSKYDVLWRMGPKTKDGYWAISKFGYPTPNAVRVIVDFRAPEMNSSEVHQALEDACKADIYDAQDEYLLNVSLVARIPRDELAELRRAVMDGRAGGANDGAPKRRARKAAAE